MSVPGDISGYNIPSSPVTAKNEGDCQALCDTYNCDWYNYSDKGNGCWLKKATNRGFIMGLM